MASKGKTVTLNTVCSMPDVNYCGLSVEVADGVISKIRPYNFPEKADRCACHKGMSSHLMAYSSDRLRYPRKRTGARGEGKWQRVSWDEALDDIAARLKDIAARYGSTSVAYAHKGSFAGAGYNRIASLTGGSVVGLMGIGDSGAPCADRATFGQILGEMYLCRMKDSRFSIIWGCNPDTTFLHRMPRIMADKKNGCRLVVIDPRFTATAARVGEHVPIRPGTDAALALSMINVIVDRGLQDSDFISKHTVGPLLVRSDNGRLLRESDTVTGGSAQKYMVFDRNAGQAALSDAERIDPALEGRYTVSGIDCTPAFQLLRDMVRQYTPEKASEITGMPAAVITRLALDYATLKPASIHRGWGLQRTFHGDLTCRAISALAAITGNINLKLPPAFLPAWHKVAWPKGQPNNIPVMLLYDAIVKGQPNRVKAAWFASHNFVNQMPDMNYTVNHVLPELELIVVADMFMTATARYADYVLPVTSFLECLDLRTIYAPNIFLTATENSYLALQQKVMEPVHKSKSDFQIAAGLGRRMGLGEFFDKTEEQYLEEVLAASQSLAPGITLEKLRNGPVLLKPPENLPKMATPTGRIEFYVEKLKPVGEDLPVYIEPVESTRTAMAKKYPLSLLTSHPRHRQHSTLANIPGLRKLDPGPFVDINPADAAPRGIADGEVVTVFNDRGEVTLKARLTPDIKKGVVNIDEGWWPEHYIDGHHNQLTHQAVNEAQRIIYEPNAAFCDVLVEVKKAQE